MAQQVKQSDLAIVARHMGDEAIDVAKILGDLGVEYAERPILTGESGWIERDENGFSVTVNSTESSQRRRFTAAHELAHYLLHRDLMDHGKVMKRHTDRLFGTEARSEDTLFTKRHEVQANRLAAQIIMPAPMIRKWYGTGERLHALSRRFGVSDAAMKIRLSTLGLEE